MLELRALDQSPNFRSSVTGEIERAFEFVIAAAKRSLSDADPASILVFGGEGAHSDDQYIEAFLEAVNYNAFGDGPVQYVAAGKGTAGVRFSFPETRRLVALLNRITEGRPEKIERSRQSYLKRIHEQVLTIPAIASKDGRERRIFKNGAAARMYVILLLLDPKLDFRDRLLKCRLRDCPRFLLTTAGKAGPRRKFCSVDHAKQNYKLKAKIRAQQWRDDRKAPKRTARKK